MIRIPDGNTLDAVARKRRQAAARPLARALNPMLNAFVQIDEALPQPASGPLRGLPYAAKDLLRTLSHHPHGGFNDTFDLGISDSSDVLDRLASAGGDLIGFTNMTELAYEPSGFNATRGRVRNPWNPDFISGGSSSGSAAVVAAGSVVAALGSDTGGSVRIPAHACGVTGWKSTYGFVSVVGAMPLAPSLDTVGVIARSAEDIMPLAPVMAELPESPTVRRAAILTDVAAECDPNIPRRLADAVAAIAACGVAIEHRPGLAAIEAIDRHSLIVMQGESARVHRSRLDDIAISPALRRRLAKGLDISDQALSDSVAARPRLTQDFELQVLAGNDLVVLPVMGILTPHANECDPGADQFSPKTLYALSRFTRFVNMLGCPAVAFPVGFDDRGMPIAAQIVGRAGCDLALLDLVRHVQSQTDWHARIPTGIAHLVPEMEFRP
jgi:aspartyl-tRNA(Asn)/glutamyl-tRNA(Gln) amidotransferase subunit A